MKIYIKICEKYALFLYFGDRSFMILYGSNHYSDEVFFDRDFLLGKNYSENTAADLTYF